MSDKCWARHLGNCDGISREHVVSSAVISGDCNCPLTTTGIHRMPDGRKGLKALVAKVLCRKHNADLSIVDSEAKKLSDFLLRLKRAVPDADIEIDGRLLERWVTKTVINCVVSGWADKEKWYPGEGIVESAFGMSAVPPLCGLYSVDADVLSSGGTSFAFRTYWGHPVDQPKELLGAHLTVNGLPLFLAVHSGMVSRIAELPGIAGMTRSDGSKPAHLHHPAAIAIHGNVPHPTVRIRLAW